MVKHGVAKQALSVSADIITGLADGVRIASVQGEPHLQYAAIGGQVLPILKRFNNMDGGDLDALATILNDIEPVIAEGGASPLSGFSQLTSNMLVTCVPTSAKAELEANREQMALYSIASDMAVMNALKAVGLPLTEDVDFKTLSSRIAEQAVSDEDVAPEVLISRIGALCFLALQARTVELARQNEESDHLRLTMPPPPADINPVLPGQEQRAADLGHTLLAQVADAANVVAATHPAMARCTKCKVDRVMVDAKEVTLRNRALTLQGKCPECGSKMSRFLPKVPA